MTTHPRPNRPPCLRRAIGLVAVLASCVALGWGARASSPVDAAGAAVTAVGATDGSASATATAVRGQRYSPPGFPMEPYPRCQILDNFGDPRSGGRTHAGADLLATLGQEVYAMADGTLTLQTFAGTGTNSSLSGNLWKLTATAGGTYYIYAHLSGFAPGLTKGSTVRAGQLIGWVGDTGNAGPGNYHLHFEIHPGGGAAVDPLPLLGIPAACTVY